ncbi:hypothetical protein CVD28_03540 [Bacillus sp. M6-12]|uniref:hypothetical protein n=1 Tax=Bacillus sp. M6-12 TaxID=2054166 RepID=UPI000C759B2C|nr:hypothetical protein [Bacillus sp. M6-12]PLS19502.1 hypothetical protein CVD28_03540 [Bacillus sp. M6-12]
MTKQHEKIKSNEVQEATEKIKNELITIINKKRGGSCLCGHRESCDICSPSPRYTGLVRDLQNYIGKM